MSGQIFNLRNNLSAKTDNNAKNNKEPISNLFAAPSPRQKRGRSPSSDENDNEDLRPDKRGFPTAVRTKRAARISINSPSTISSGSATGDRTEKVVIEIVSISGSGDKPPNEMADRHDCNGIADVDGVLQSNNNVPGAASNNIAGGSLPFATNESQEDAAVTDEAIREAPRKYGIDLQGSWSQDIATKKDLSSYVERYKPVGCNIREVIKTMAGKILVFPTTTKDYNLLLRKERWKTGSGISPAPAPRSKSKSAIIIMGVEDSFSIEEIMKEMRMRSFTPNGGMRMKRASDGQETGSVKIFMDNETQIERALKEGIFLKLFRHQAKRYQPPRFTQCHRCQSLEHGTQGCKSERRCMRCTGNHHHKDCLRTPDQYVCSNCALNHASSDPRCERIIAAKSAALTNPLPAMTERGPSPPLSRNLADFPPLPGCNNPPQLALADPLNQIGFGETAKNALISEIKSAVKEAVVEALRENVGDIFKEAAISFAQEMSKSLESINTATSQLVGLVGRYVNERSKKDSAQNADNHLILNASTPIPTGRQGDQPSNTPLPANPPVVPSAPSLTEDPTTFTIHFPPTSLKIKKGTNEQELAKIINDERTTRTKIFKKDLRIIQQEIINKNNLPPSPTPPPPSEQMETNDQAPSKDANDPTQPPPVQTRGRVGRPRGGKAKGRANSLPRMHIQLKKFIPDALQPNDG